MIFTYFTEHLPSFLEQQTYQDPATINIDSKDFKSLPAEIQHELIKEIKEERKWRNKHDMPRVLILLQLE